MDEIDALRGMRTALAEDESPDALASRIRWRAGTGSPAPESAPRPLRRRLRLPLAGGLAAVLAAGAAAIVMTQPGSDAPEHVTPLVEGNVLLVAATNAEKAPLGAYWHTRSISGDIYAVGGSAKNFYKVDSRQGNESWTGRDGSGETFHLDPPDVPLTAQDAQKWRAAGSRRMVRVPDPEGAVGSVYLDMAGTGPAGPFPVSPGDLAYGLTPARLDRLPTEPKALESALLDLKGDWHAYTATAKKEPIRALRGQERIRALSEVTIALLSTAPAPPKVRAAAFRMLAAQPGVRAGGRTADPLGRSGTVISLPLKTTVPLGLYTAPKQLGTYTRELIVDPARGMLLAVQDLVATPPKGGRPLPPGDDGKPRSLAAKNMPDRFSRPGDLASYQAFEVAQWTDQAPPR
ncbi:CU044_5270 family protein [Actinomadura violacea]|uniref:CU044_5270 family protein n=1 Tax=Actinomadura violacea TaxID=2819934 RepID=A0ABS3RTX2_9ACTN|nr:CU044_5270 family protein [Actinomadura violacea]MBO2460112.1 CU044_5270 family protein [Actinomadura violacea]